MVDTFHVGEVAIITVAHGGGENWPEYIGEEVVVTGVLAERSVWADRARTNVKLIRCYTVLAGDGHKLSVLPPNLRKKRLPPPREELGDWDLCPWKPGRVLAEVGKSEVRK